MSGLQFDNPGAPDYDWQKDREWFNQRLANANLERFAIEMRVGDLRGVLKAIMTGKMTKPAMRDLAKKAIESDDRKRAAASEPGSLP